MEMTYYDLKIYDNGMVRGVLQEDIEALPFFDYWQKMNLCSTQGIYIDENGKENRLVYLHDWEKFCRLFAREQELLNRTLAGSKNERSDQRISIGGGGYDQSVAHFGWRRNSTRAAMYFDRRQVMHSLTTQADFIRKKRRALISQNRRSTQIRV